MRVLCVRVFLPIAFVQLYAQHQQDHEHEHADKAINPVEGAFQDHQEHHRKQDYGGYLVPNPHKLGCVPNIVPLHLFKDLVAFKMIYEQQYHKSQLYMHPWLLDPAGHQNHQPKGKNGAQNGRGPGDDIPQATGHQFQLFGQDLFIGRWFLPCFNMIDEQPGDVEQARKPGDHKDQVQRFNVCVQQLLGVLIFTFGWHLRHYPKAFY